MVHYGECKGYLVSTDGCDGKLKCIACVIEGMKKNGNKIETKSCPKDRTREHYYVGHNVGTVCCDPGHMSSFLYLHNFQGFPKEDFAHCEPKSIRYVDVPKTVCVAAAGYSISCGGEDLKCVNTNGLAYYPIQFLDNDQGVLMRSREIEYTTRKQPENADYVRLSKRITDTESILAELRIALANNQKALDHAANGGAEEVSEVGAIYLEKHRLEREQKTQQDRLNQARQEQFKTPRLNPKYLYETKMWHMEFILKPGANRVGDKVIHLQKISNTTSTSVVKVISQTFNPKTY